MTMSISNHTFKTNEILTIWYRIMAPEGPTGGTRAPPRPPLTIRRHHKSRGKWQVFGKRIKTQKKYHRKQDHVNMRLCLLNQRHINNVMPPRAPSPKFKHWVWPFYRGGVTFFKNPLNNQKVKCFMTNVCLFNYAYKSLLILTISNQVGAPGGPPDPPKPFGRR